MIFDEKGWHAAVVRGGKKRGGTQASPLSIEGESITLEQIADRLGVTPSCASTRLKRSAKLPGPITWERLGLKP